MAPREPQHLFLYSRHQTWLGRLPNGLRVTHSQRWQHSLASGVPECAALHWYKHTRTGGATLTLTLFCERSWFLFCFFTLAKEKEMSCCIFAYCAWVVNNWKGGGTIFICLTIFFWQEWPLVLAICAATISPVWNTKEYLFQIWWRDQNRGIRTPESNSRKAMCRSSLDIYIYLCL